MKRLALLLALILADSAAPAPAQVPAAPVALDPGEGGPIRYYGMDGFVLWVAYSDGHISIYYWDWDRGWVLFAYSSWKPPLVQADPPDDGDGVTSAAAGASDVQPVAAVTYKWSYRNGTYYKERSDGILEAWQWSSVFGEWVLVGVTVLPPPPTTVGAN